MKAKINLKNVISFLQGWVRYKVFNTWLDFLIPKHIKEQYQVRLDSTDIICMSSGACKNCGCEIPKLQYANKGCAELCYPRLLSKKDWKCMKQGCPFLIQGVIWKLDLHKRFKVVSTNLTPAG